MIISNFLKKSKTKFIKDAKYAVECIKCNYSQNVSLNGILDCINKPCSSCNELFIGKSKISVDSDDYSENSIWKSYLILSGRIELDPKIRPLIG